MHHHRDELAAELARNSIPFSIEGMDVLDTTEVRDLLACLGAVVADTDSAALFRVSALRQFSVDPNELRSAIRSLPRDNTATIASVLSRGKEGDAGVNTMRQPREEAAGNKTYSVLLSLARMLQLARSTALDPVLV